MSLFEKAVSSLRKAPDEARQAIRDVDARAEAAISASVGPPAKARKRLLELQNAIVEVKKHHATAVANVRRLDRAAGSYGAEEAEPVAEQRRLQGAFVEEMRAALARAEAALIRGQWAMAEGSARVAITEAGEAMARVRAAADRAAAMPDERFAKRFEKIIDGLDRDMTAAKRCVATSIADEKRFLKAAAEMDEPPPLFNYPPRPPDAEALARVLAAQKAVVEAMKDQLRDVNDRVELLRRKARIIEARRKLGL